MELFRVEIPQHIREVKLSDKQNPKYFEWNGESIKGKSKKIPIRYFIKDVQRTDKILIEQLKEEYRLGVFKNNKLIDVSRNTEYVKFHYYNTKIFKVRLCHLEDTFNVPVLCNPKAVGTPRIYVIKGQDIYSGNLRENMRGTIMQVIKDQYKIYISNCPVITAYPVRIECEVHDTIGNFYDSKTYKNGLGQAWDIDNYAYPYMKAFPDVLQELGKLKNDDRLHLTQPPNPIFCPIEDHNNRKLVFIVSTDERDVIKNNEIYQNFHKDSYESEDTELVKDNEPFVIERDKDGKPLMSLSMMVVDTKNNTMEPYNKDKHTKEYFKDDKF